MDKEQENISTEKTTLPVYPDPTKGSFADDHTNYAKDVKFAGGDPDKNNKIYFFIFIIFMCFLFIMAVQSIGGASFIF